MHTSYHGPAHGGGVAWREWNEESFRLARDLDRPILLDISAVWCHWCHVMDQTSYSDPVVIDLIQRYFVPIRVDNDRRPDINERYNMGGWPTTAFLTPAGDVLTGGTYFPPEQMRALLVRVARYYQDNKQNIARHVAARQRAPVPTPKAQQDLDPGIVGDVLASVADAFDPVHGGFGDAPKFPHPDAIELALRDYEINGSRSSLTIAMKTLDAMAAGGIYDPVEGGFFRYATRRDWSVPHYEKMLEGNAGLLRNYLHAFQVTGEQSYAATARDIIRYVTTVLADPQEGVFFGSQDADEAYYALPLDQRRQRQAPFVDRTVYTDWNAMAASAYLLAGILLKEPELEAAALRTINRLWSLCYEPGRGMYHYHDGKPQLPGLLGDNVWMGLALLDAYEVTGGRDYLSQAEDLAAFCLGSLADADGGFRDRMEQPDALGSLKIPFVPITGNATAARFLVRLAWLTGDERYRQAAARTLARFSLEYDRYGFFAAPYALAVDEYTRPPLKITVVGMAGDQRTAALHRAALALPQAWKIVQIIDPERDGDLCARSGLPRSDRPLAYPCVGTLCLAPVDDVEHVQALAQNTHRRTSQGDVS